MKKKPANSLDPVVVNLTLHQVQKLIPFQNELRRMADSKKPGMLVAQIFDDHMRVGIVKNDKAITITKDATKLIYQAPERNR